MTNVTTLQPLDPLKVFVEYDPQYEVYVAQCLQTGHLVTADDPDAVTEMITELLTDEVSLAVRNNDIPSLLSSPAPTEQWFKFDLASKAGAVKDGSTIRVSGEVSHELRVLVGHDHRAVEVTTEIRIATGKVAGAA